MTEAEILALPIDKLERAIGEQIFELNIFFQALPKYARDIGAAKSATDAIAFSRPSMLVRIDCSRWCGKFVYSVEIVGWIWPKPGDMHVRVEAATEEEARARAALMAHWRMKGKETQV